MINMLRNPSHSLPWIIALLVVVIYMPALAASFQFDDWQVVVGNPRVSSLSAWWQSMPGMRALLKLSYALNHETGGGVRCFRAVNILLHAMNAALLFMLARRLVLRLGCNNDGAGGTAIIAGTVTALVFALHPAQTESVTYISGRSNSFAALWIFLTLLAWLKYREKGAGVLWLFLAAAAFIAALVCKETAAALPLAMLLYLAVEPGRRIFRDYIQPLAFAALAILLFAVAWPRLPYDYLLRVSLETRGPMENLAAQSQGVIWLIGQLFDWSRLNADPMLQPVIQWTPGVIVTTTALAAVIVAALLSLRRYPIPVFAVLWFFIWLAPTNSLIARLDVANDRQLYIAIAGPAFLLGYIIAWGKRHAVQSAQPESERTHRYATTMLAVSILFIAGAAGTINRNRVYATETTFWRDVVDKSPHNQRAWNNLGMADALECRIDSAMRAFEEAIRLAPDYPQPQINLELLKIGELPGLPEQCRGVGDPP